MIQDWHRDTATREVVILTIGQVLEKTLPVSYDRPLFAATRDHVFQHFYHQAVQARATA